MTPPPSCPVDISPGDRRSEPWPDQSGGWEGRPRALEGDLLGCDVRAVVRKQSPSADGVCEGNHPAVNASTPSRPGGNVQKTQHRVNLEEGQPCLESLMGREFYIHRRGAEGKRMGNSMYALGKCQMIGAGGLLEGIGPEIWKRGF